MKLSNDPERERGKNIILMMINGAFLLLMHTRDTHNATKIFIALKRRVYINRLLSATLERLERHGRTLFYRWVSRILVKVAFDCTCRPINIIDLRMINYPMKSILTRTFEFQVHYHLTSLTISKKKKTKCLFVLFLIKWISAVIYSSLWWDVVEQSDN